MIRFIIKVLITSILIAVISEVGKRNSLMAAIYASLPMITLLAMVWLYLDSSDVQKAASLSWNVLIAIVPGCVFLIAFPLLVKFGLNFWISMLISIILTTIAYWAYFAIIRHFGINL